MATETIHASAVIDAKPAAIYEAFLDGDTHTAMTGGGATSTPRVGTRFTAWDGYITGKHLELQPGRRIVQDWRTTQFPGAAPDSRLSPGRRRRPEARALKRAPRSRRLAAQPGPCGGP